MNQIKEKKWFNGAVIACIGVAFYVLLTHFGAVMTALKTFIGYFKPVIFGVIIAYVISPLAKCFYFRFFRKMKPGQVRWYLSVILAVTLTLLAILFLLGTLIPQLLKSLEMFSENIDGYAKALTALVKQSPLHSAIDMEGLETISENALSTIISFVKRNSSHLLGIAASSGKNILMIGIGLILAVYLLLNWQYVVINLRKFFGLMLSKEAYESFLDFILRCDTILVSYIVQSLLDALIVGTANAIFMTICRMPYIGLVSVVVGVTNLIPNFGPIIGGVIGAFILLLVNPMQALIFGVFTLILQFVDGYILKPKLFSNSLGVSSLLILVSTIVLGNMFGIVGILLSIPTAAVLSFIYRDYFYPWKEKRKNRDQSSEKQSSEKQQTEKQ